MLNSKFKKLVGSCLVMALVFSMSLPVYAFNFDEQSGHLTVGKEIEDQRIETMAPDLIREIRTVTIENGVDRISAGAFQNCTNLRTITIPESVTDIGRCAFKNCTSLTSIAIPAGVSIIRPGTFQDCEQLNNVRVQPGITEIGECAFQRCVSLSQLNIPNTVQTVSLFAFNGCRSLTVGVPESLIFFGEKAFCGCRGLIHLDAYGNVEPNNEEDSAADDFLFDPDGSTLEVDLEGAIMEILINGVYQSSRLNSI